MTESLYLSLEASHRLNKLLSQMEDLLKTDPGSGLKMQLLRHNLFDLIRALPLSSQTRKKTEALLHLTEKGAALGRCRKEAENEIRGLRGIYRLEKDSAASAADSHSRKCVLI